MKRTKKLIGSEGRDDGRSPLAAGNDTQLTDRCPCGTGKTYELCCAPLHRAERHAATCEQLMRARYTGHVIGDEGFLLRTWDASTRPTEIGFVPSLRWTGLEILESTGGNLLDKEGTVSFIAHYKSSEDGTVVAGNHQETSRFGRYNERWVYLDAI